MKSEKGKGKRRKWGRALAGGAMAFCILAGWKDRKPVDVFASEELVEQEPEKQEFQKGKSYGLSLTEVKNDAGIQAQDEEGIYYFGESLQVTLEISVEEQEEEGEEEGNEGEGSGGDEGEKGEGPGGTGGEGGTGEGLGGSEGEKGEDSEGSGEAGGSGESLGEIGEEKEEGLGEEGGGESLEGSGKAGESREGSGGSEGEKGEDSEGSGEGSGGIEPEDPEEPFTPLVFLKRNGEVLAQVEGTMTYTDVLEESGEYIYVLENTDKEHQGQPVRVQAQRSKESPQITLSYPDYAARYGNTVFFREAPDILAKIQDTVGILKIEYRDEAADQSGVYHLLEEYGSREDYPAKRHVLFDKSLKLGDLKEKLEKVSEGSCRYGFRVTNGVGNTAEAQAHLVLDQTPPMLELRYAPGAAEEETGRIFYQGEAVTDLKLRETWYRERVDEEQRIVEPEVVIEGDHRSGATVEPWTDGQTDAGDSVRSKVILPGKMGEEVSYRIHVSYEDCAGNSLRKEADTWGEEQENGVVSCELVVDQRPPRLLSFETEGITRYQTGKIPVYQRNEEQGDVQISFVIQDNPDYWDHQAVDFKIYRKGSSVPVADFSQGKGTEQTFGRWEWEHTGDRHRAVCHFYGEEDQAGEYYAQLSYRDRAGNPLEDGNGAGEYLSKTPGVFQGKTFILDHRAPEITVFCPRAVSLLDQAGAHAPEEFQKIPAAGYTGYYGDSIKISLEIREEYPSWLIEGDRRELQDFSLRIRRDGQLLEDLPKVSWRYEPGEQICYGSFCIQGDKKEHGGDGSYEIEISYEDCGGNQMTAGDLRTERLVQEGCYRSPVLILDATPPELSFQYSMKQEAEQGGTRYFRETGILRLTLSDRSFRMGEFKESLQGLRAENQRGEELTEQTALWRAVQGLEDSLLCNTVQSIELPLTEDGTYEIPMAYRDLAGNEAVWAGSGLPVGQSRERACVDQRAPDLKLTCQVEEAGFLDCIRYKSLAFWTAGQKLTMTVQGEDDTAGIRGIRFTVTDEQGRETVREKEFPASFREKDSLVLPLQEQDFKGSIKAEVTDWSGNTAERLQYGLVESRERHRESQRAEIVTRSQPSRVVDGVEYYREDVELCLELSDSYGGIRKVSYTAGNEISGEWDCVQEGTEAEGISELTHRYTKELVLSAAVNNRNHVPVQVSFTDHGGHEETAEKLYQIDSTVPTITVEYDLNTPVHEAYYSQARTAQVTVRERNFDPRDVVFTVTNTAGSMPKIGGWTSSGEGDDTRNVCQVIFEEDGEYTFTVEFQDLAGNQAEYDRVDAFVIDTTFPELTVAYEDTAASQGGYYAGGRRAVLTVREHNFDPALMEVRILAEDGEAPALSKWIQNQDIHQAQIDFERDGSYTFFVGGRDLAGNELQEYEAEPFVIDQTAPELEIRGVGDKSANNGEIALEIRGRDKHYDPAGTRARLKGFRNKEQEIRMGGSENPQEDILTADTWIQSSEGMELRFQDIPCREEMDDLYTLEAEIRDLAGNQVQSQLEFSVNRFGSVYTLDQETEELAGRNGSFYTQTAPRITVTETNVDTLEFKEIICNRDGSLRTLEEGRDYQVQTSGEEGQWKQYTYHLNRENFQQEGVYRISIYSEDRAKNTSDNNTKGKELEFAVDQSSPWIQVFGLEDKAQYRENSRRAVVDVQDNLCLAEVRIVLNGREHVYGAGELRELEGKIPLVAESAGHWQQLMVTARDGAGNVRRLESLSFLITPNIFIPFLLNRPLFYTSIGAAVILAAALGVGLWRKRKPKKAGS